MADSQVPWGVEALSGTITKPTGKAEAELVPARDRGSDGPYRGSLEVSNPKKSIVTTDEATAVLGPRGSPLCARAYAFVVAGAGVLSRSNPRLRSTPVRFTVSLRSS